MRVETVELFSILVFFIGFYGLIASDNIVKSVVAISLMEVAVVMFFLSIGFVNDILPPVGENLTNVADPLPQALVITAIIIGVTVTAINLIMVISLNRKYKTNNWQIAKERSRED